VDRPDRFNAANVAAGTAYLGSNSPRLYDDSAANQTGNIDTTYGNGPDFANNDYFGFSLTGQHQFNDDLSLKSISGYRQIAWRTGTDLDGTRKPCRKSPTTSTSGRSPRSSS